MREGQVVWGCVWFSCTGCNAGAWLWLLLVGCAGCSGSFLIVLVGLGCGWSCLVVLCWFILFGLGCSGCGHDCEWLCLAELVELVVLCWLWPACARPGGHHHPLP